MTRSTRMLSLTLAAGLILQLPLLSIANAQQNSATAKQTRARALYQSMNMLPDGGVCTTGGTVNPGLTGDQMQHGYNGG
jgi:hypothetical protein